MSAAKRWLCGCEDLVLVLAEVRREWWIPWQGVVSCTTVSALNSCCVSPGPKIPRSICEVSINQHASQKKKKVLESVCITFSYRLDFLWVPTRRSTLFWFLVFISIRDFQTSSVTCMQPGIAKDVATKGNPSIWLYLELRDKRLDSSGKTFSVGSIFL